LLCVGMSFLLRSRAPGPEACVVCTARCMPVPMRFELRVDDLHSTAPKRLLSAGGATIQP
jgi:hypothetical protein